MLKAFCCPYFFRSRALTTSSVYGSGETIKGYNVLIKMLLIMNFTALFVFMACLAASAAGYGQNVSIDIKNESLEKLFTELRKQTGCNIVYYKDDLRNAKNINLRLENADLKEVLKIAFKNQPLAFTIFDNSIIVKVKPAAELTPRLIEHHFKDALPITGIVRGPDGQPLAGATVLVKASKKFTSTNADGIFTLNANAGDVLVVSFVGHQSTEYKITTAIIESFNRQPNDDEDSGFPSLSNLIIISLKQAVKEEEEIVVAYNKTTVQRNVSSLTVVKGETIADLPNRSFERSLQGQVPGLLITGGNGQPGGGTSNFILRGIATAAGGVARQPLIVIDGIPITQEMTQKSVIAGTTPVTNPLSQLNINDIETFTVLKDASATALYGSKAANGGNNTYYEKRKFRKNEI